MDLQKPPNRVSINYPHNADLETVFEKTLPVELENSREFVYLNEVINLLHVRMIYSPLLTLGKMFN